MISHKHKFIFIEVPKTGTRSICSVLENNFSAVVLRPHLGASKWHTHLERYQARFPKKIPSYFKFCFVRNPWDKIVSQYHFNRHSFGMNDYTFEEYVHAFKRGKRISWLNYDFLSWMTDDKGNMLMNFVGRFENLQEDFNIVCDKIGVPRQKLPHRNKTKRTHYTEYYDDETREIVAEKYAKDIEYFGYKFGE